MKKILFGIIVLLMGCSYKMEYRIVKNDLGYYPQVKDNMAWHKIAKHPTGYGLYPSDDYEYPKTIDECEKIIEEYKAWTKLSKEMKIVKEY